MDIRRLVLLSVVITLIICVKRSHQSKGGGEGIIIVGGAHGYPLVIADGSGSKGSLRGKGGGSNIIILSGGSGFGHHHSGYGHFGSYGHQGLYQQQQNQYYPQQQLYQQPVYGLQGLGGYGHWGFG